MSNMKKIIEEVSEHTGIPFTEVTNEDIKKYLSEKESK
jgi:predicted house-cleaning NTP pyrophosphatase (Maf/HAM1 superfamily)